MKSGLLSICHSFILTVYVNLKVVENYTIAFGKNKVFIDVNCNARCFMAKNKIVTEVNEKEAVFQR